MNQSRLLSTFLITVFFSISTANHSWAEEIADEAMDTLMATNGVLYKMAGWSNEETKRILKQRLATNKPLLETISQDGFKEENLDNVENFVRFTDQVLNEQTALVYMANLLAQMADQEGLSFDEVLAKRRFLMEEWKYCMAANDLSKNQIASLLNRMLYFGLNEKYKSQSQLTQTQL